MKAVLISVGIAMMAALPAWAHHALASEFKIKEMISMTGVITKIDWSNPHARLYLESKGQGGDVMKWDFEMASPNLLMLHGWKIDTMRQGDRVTVDGYPSRDGSNRGYATKVTRAAP